MSEETKTQFRAGLEDVAIYRLHRAGIKNVTVEVCDDGGSVRLELSGTKTDLAAALRVLHEYKPIITEKLAH